MRCPFCSRPDTRVVDTRAAENDAAVRRRRFCATCSGRFTTFERIQIRDLTIIKRNGQRAAFSRDKLTKSLSVALRKRPVKEENIDHMVSSIISRLEKQGETEIPSSVIGSMIMNILAGFDKVAYIRFASVYGDFTGIEDFENLLKKMTEPDGNQSD